MKLIIIDGFEHIPLAPPDPIFHLNASYTQDPHPEKISLGIGAYRDNQGNPWILPVVKKVRIYIINLIL